MYMEFDPDATENLSTYGPPDVDFNKRTEIDTATGMTTTEVNKGP